MGRLSWIRMEASQDLYVKKHKSIFDNFVFILCHLNQLDFLYIFRLQRLALILDQLLNFHFLVNVVEVMLAST